jgi:hypothetical protein
MTWLHKSSYGGGYRDRLTGMKKGKSKKVKGKNENASNGHASLTFTLCLLPFAFILSIPV